MPELPLTSVTRRVGQMIGLRGGKLSPLVRLQLLRTLPSVARLSYRLLRDQRVPTSTKVMAGGALALIYSPVDVLQYVPLIGQLSDLALTVSVLEVFIRQCPANVVAEHRAALGMV